MKYDDGFYTEDVDLGEIDPEDEWCIEVDLEGVLEWDSVLSLSLVDGHLVADFGDRVYSVKK